MSKIQKAGKPVKPIRAGLSCADCGCVTYRADNVALCVDCEDLAKRTEARRRSECRLPGGIEWWDSWQRQALSLIDRSRIDRQPLEDRLEIASRRLRDLGRGIDPANGVYHYVQAVLAEKPVFEDRTVRG